MCVCRLCALPTVSVDCVSVTTPTHPPVGLQEWEYAKVRQDAQLERIERGVGTLADMAKGMQVRPY